MVNCCLLRVWEEDAFGSISLITLGFTRVDTIRKKSMRKNMISLMELAPTSAENLLWFLLMFMP
jgi:hypothetical protein